MLAELAYQTFEADRLFFPRQEIVNLIQEFLAGNLNAPQDLDGEMVLRAIEVQQGILVERARNSCGIRRIELLGMGIGHGELGTAFVGWVEQSETQQ